MRFSDLRVGNTPLIEIPQLSGRYGCRVLMKDESANPFGTFKDRRNYMLLSHDYNEPGPIYYVQITYGNSGISMARLCEAWNSEYPQQERHAINIVPKGFPRKTKRELEKTGIVEEIDLGRKVIYNHELPSIGQMILGKHNGIVKPVEQEGRNGDGYGAIVRELRAELDDTIDYMFLPVGEGELAVKVASELGGARPHIVGATTQRNIFAYDDSTEFVPHIGAGVADKLSTGYSDFRSRLKSLFDRYGHEIRVMNDAAITSEHAYIRSQHIAAEEAAATAFAAAGAFERFKPGDTAVIMNTGDGGIITPRENWTSSLRERIDTAALLAALCGGLFLISDSMTPDAQTRRQKSEIKEIESSSVEYIKNWNLRELANNPTMNSMVAYAVWRGRGTIDMIVLGDLTYYYIYPDGSQMMRDIYREGTRARENLDGYQLWLEDQKTNRERENERVAQAWNEHFAYEDSLRAAESSTENKK